jgi:hypothetical protein
LRAPDRDRHELMFTNRQPREVYRVYGEEEFFAEDPQQLEPQPIAASAVQDPADQIGHESAHVAPDIFDEYDTVARGAPVTHDAAPLTDPWAPVSDSTAITEEDPYESLPPFSPLIATQAGSPRRTIGISLIAAAVGLLVGLIVVSGLRSGHSSGVTKSPPAQAQIAKVSTAPTTITPRAKTSHHRAPAGTPRRPTPRRLDRAPRRARARPVIEAHVKVAQSSLVSQVPRVEIPASVPVPIYAPAPPSGGMEFGFEH